MAIIIYNITQLIVFGDFFLNKQSIQIPLYLKDIIIYNLIIWYFSMFCYVLKSVYYVITYQLSFQFSALMLCPHYTVFPKSEH